MTSLQNPRVSAFWASRVTSSPVRYEPGTDAEIKAFATEKYGVKFDMFSKINVNGDAAHPLWKYLKEKKGGFLGSFIKWNFTKFLIDKEGQVVKRYGPKEDPFDAKKDFPKYW
ncbi:hypothetical protein NP493_630g00007 [Ridgeia piscesae]|uniref:Glutathione peroxidase n=1 Tax=Ridgeia piscesae TaxID=27915 RepID=A0AAD9KSN8_RIDPI|nr:hypothetical protein NP493_630g00007 [Ridgeia piscesae]